MSRFVRCALLTAASVVVLGVSVVVGMITTGVSAGATPGSNYPWLRSAPEVINEADMPVTSLPYKCSGFVRSIPVRQHSELVEACVFGEGEGTRVARFSGLSGGFVYAIAFSSESYFTPILDICGSFKQCVYGQEADVLLVETQLSNGLGVRMIKNFSQHLKRYTDNGTYYRLEGEREERPLMLGGAPAQTQAIAVSRNGRWAFIELVTYGFVRVELSTLSYRRVVAPGAQYGYGANPSYELAISDTGNEVGITGWRGGIEVYAINPTCGDTLSDASLPTFAPHIEACPGASLGPGTLFPGFISGYAPHFSRDGRHLSLIVESPGKLRIATVSPGEYAGAVSPSYVAFGDSFTSGEGESDDSFYHPHTNTTLNRCHVSTRSYPYLLGAAWSEPTLNRACSGARIGEVRMESKKAQAEAATPATRISVSVGGNDIELIGKLKTCLGVGLCAWAAPEKRQEGAEEIRRIYPRIVALLQEFKLEHPRAQIALVGYPQVINTVDGAQCGIVLSSMLAAEERRYMAESLRYLNQVLKAAAHSAEVTYLDVEASYEGVRLCDQTPLAMNAVRLGDDIAPLPFLKNFKIIGAESFHPTPKGHELLAQFVQTRSSNWKASLCACSFAQSELSPPPYWTEGSATTPLLSQVADTFLSSQTVVPGGVATATFPKGSFAPESSVTFELHSEPIELARVRAGSDGSLVAQLSIPDMADGYHSVHALGESSAGERLDVYQIVSLEAAVTEPPVYTPVASSIQPTAARPDGGTMSMSEGVPGGMSLPKQSERSTTPIVGIPPIVPPQADVLGVSNTLPATRDETPAPMSVMHASILGAAVILGVGFGIYVLLRRVQGNGRYNGHI